MIYKFSQIKKREGMYLNCERHMMIFQNKKIIPEFCFGCYKVQIEPSSVIELIKLFILFENIKLKRNNTRKCFVELRENIEGTYKGLIYCSNLEEAYLIADELNQLANIMISKKLRSSVKRGCSEYGLAFPKYKEINKHGIQSMTYPEEWREIENNIDREPREWGKSTNTLKDFSLNKFLIIKNWIQYGQNIGDSSANLFN